MKILATVYSHPEYYPPTLNAIRVLSKKFEKTIVLARNVKAIEWEYPTNVSIKLSGKFKSIRDTENESIIWKAISFIKYSFCFYKILINEKPKWVICYDPIPLLSFRLVSLFIFNKPKLWYHNHDVLQHKDTQSFSISRLAVKNEQKSFNTIDIFSLPSEERKIAFPIKELKGKYFFIPNYPSIFYLNYQPKPSIKNKEKINFIFQGSIGYNHGLEEIISYIPELNEKFNKKFGLVLKGFINEEYKNHILNHAIKCGVYDDIKIIGIGPYREVFEISSTCDIGLAIHQTDDLMNKTLGTSSNKIYEYIAVGLPVILLDNQHFKKHLGERKWAFFTDLTKKSLLDTISLIVGNYEHISEYAISDFKNDLNFENNFAKILTYITPKN